MQQSENVLEQQRPKGEASEQKSKDQMRGSGSRQANRRDSSGQPNLALPQSSLSGPLDSNQKSEKVDLNIEKVQGKGQEKGQEKNQYKGRKKGQGKGQDNGQDKQQEKGQDKEQDKQQDRQGMQKQKQKQKGQNKGQCEQIVRQWSKERRFRRERIVSYDRDKMKLMSRSKDKFSRVQPLHQDTFNFQSRSREFGLSSRLSPHRADLFGGTKLYPEPRLAGRFSPERKYGYGWARPAGLWQQPTTRGRLFSNEGRRSPGWAYRR